MSRHDPVDLISGVLVFAAGTFFFFGAQEYRMGTVTRMGPGFVPQALGAVGMVLGAVIALAALNRPGALPRPGPRAVLSVLCSIAAFALVLPRLGLVPAALSTAAIAMTGNPGAGWRMIAATALAISATCGVIFVVLLGLPIRPFWWGP